MQRPLDAIKAGKAGIGISPALYISVYCVAAAVSPGSIPAEISDKFNRIYSPGQAIGIIISSHRKINDTSIA